MTYRTKAVYHRGAFVPTTRCDLPEDSEVDLLVEGPLHESHTVADPQQRASLMRRITDRMKSNPIPHEAPRFTRDELHERR
jgi:hypothetical protein